MIKKIISLSLLTFTISLSNPVFAKDNAGLNTQQIKALKVLNKPVVIAGWIPKGFKVEKVKVSLETQENPGGISNYKIIYSNYPKKFSIESQSSGLGDDENVPNLEVDTKFGKTGVFVNTKCVSSDWIRTKNGSIMFSGCDSEALNRNENANSISKDDAIKIIKNLKLLQ